ncbi:MAG: PEP-CTERM sorting domain-containing protein [Gammaproteobacteria bacterium]|nr:PEP-CTERM sorting domain-containing protein [Gammaproteobacteria bacterium]
MIRLALLSLLVLAAPLSQAASTTAYGQARAQDSCRTVTECNAAPVPVLVQVIDEQTNGNGATVGTTVLAYGTRDLTSSGAFTTSSLGVLEVSARADGAGPVSRAARSTTEAAAISRAEFSDTLTVTTMPGLAGGYVTFRFYLTGNLETLTFGDAGTSSASATLSASFQTPATYLPPSQGGNNIDTLKYQLVDPYTGSASLTTYRDTLRNGVIQPRIISTEQLADSDAGHFFLASHTLTFTQWVPFNVATSFVARLEATAGGAFSQPCADLNNPGCDATGGFSASADNEDLVAALALQAVTDAPAAVKAGLRWGGISSIRTAAGQEIRDLVTVTSGSGVDYLNEIQAVPAPGTLVLLGTALIGMLARRCASKPVSSASGTCRAASNRP